MCLIDNVFLLVLTTTPQNAERFLENRVEPARNSLEREGERYLRFKNHSIKFLVRHCKFKCHTIKKKQIDIF